MISFGTSATPGVEQQVTSALPQKSLETEAQAYLAKIDDMLALAATGQYGMLKRGAAAQLQSERNRIASLLGTQATVAELPPDDRLAIQNAEDSITAILRNKEKERMVCTREAKTGTRFATSECMTVSEREARAKAAAEAVGDVQRETCVPNEFNSCAGGG